MSFTYRQFTRLVPPFAKAKTTPLHPSLEDVGVCWGIGAPEGGHKAIHPQLGTTADFQEFVAAAAEFGIEVALDLSLPMLPRPSLR